MEQRFRAAWIPAYAGMTRNWGDKGANSASALARMRSK